MGLFHIRAPQYDNLRNQRNQSNQNNQSNQSNQSNLLSEEFLIPRKHRVFYPPPPPFGYYPYLRGRVSYRNTAPANCPPEKVGEEGL